jgi:membrane-bound lytic murein transglycosylase F
MNAKSDAIYAKILRLTGSLLLCGLPLLLTGSRAPTLLEQVREQGYLNVLSINGPTTYYKDHFGYAGFEYELARAFANSLEVELVVHDAQDLGSLLKMVGSSLGSFAAAGLTVTPERQKKLKFTTPYLTVIQKVIYRRGEYRPKTVADLVGKDILVVANSPHAENLKLLQQQYPALRWREVPDLAMLDLVEMVHSGNATMAIVDSNAFTIYRDIYPRAQSAFDITPSEPKAWAFPKTEDDTLYREAQAFIENYIVDEKLDALVEKYYLPDNAFDESSALIFAKRIEQLLPKWKPHFQTSAKEIEADWLLLAAISYQESHWNPHAESPTGVRGMMMLTELAADDVGVTDRTDPLQSIYGGAKYFDHVLRRIPVDVSVPDRTWMALAAYNVGYGHLQDARMLTEQQGGNPNLWRDVQQRLPLLAERKYYRNTIHGFARGWEPVDYVENVRNFYKILAWHQQSQKRRLAARSQEKLQPITLSSITEQFPWL